MKVAVLLILAGTVCAQTTKPSVAKPSAAKPLFRTLAPSSYASALSSRSSSQGTVSLPVGTALYMKLQTRLSTTRTVPGGKFSGYVSQPVMLDSRTVIPVGASIEGHVTRVTEPRRIRGHSTLKLRPELIVLPNGERWTLNAVVVDTSMHPFVEVDDEGAIKGQGWEKDDSKEMGITTGGGILLGTLAGGGTGLVVGAGVGAAAGFVHWLTKRHSAELPAGTEIIMEISRPTLLGAVGE